VDLDKANENPLCGLSALSPADGGAGGENYSSTDFP